MMKEGIELHSSFTLKEIAMLKSIAETFQEEQIDPHSAMLILSMQMTMMADIANKETKKQEAENEKDTAEAVPKSKVTS